MTLDPQCHCSCEELILSHTRAVSLRLLLCDSKNDCNAETSAINTALFNSSLSVGRNLDDLFKKNDVTNRLRQFYTFGV